MLQIHNIEAKSLSVENFDLYWEIADTYEDPLDYTFIVERSESPMGPFDQISEAFSDKYWFRDIATNQFHSWRQFFYRIKVTKKTDSSVSYSPVTARQAKPDLIADEVRRLELIAFREHIGRVCWIFPIKTFGQRCPDCFDSVTKSRLRANCEACFSTGYARGYLDPIAQYVQINPGTKHTESLQVTQTQQVDVSAKLSYFPPVKPKDIIVEVENVRWRVKSVSSTERLRAVLHQEVGIHRIAASDIEYKIPVNLDDLRNFEASPEREFTNPHTLEAVTEENWFADMLRGHGY
jgi:hypothetical protein